MGRIAYVGARIFDGELWWDRSALVVSDGRIETIVAANAPTDAQRIVLEGGIIAPGFIDLQINGGGGRLFNDDPSVETIATMCATCTRFGTTACLPTLISSTREIRDAAIAAGIAAAAKELRGFLGLHLEGPHLSSARKGAHAASHIRPMDEDDVRALIAARQSLPNLLVTVAVEGVTPNQITRLSEAGIVVGIGHSDGSYDAVRTAAEAGATLVTHLFNAQSQFAGREPGVVGAALDLGVLHVGLIADGVHVHPASIAVALRAKRGPGRVFLVTDAMPPAGTDAESFELGGRAVYRRDGALRLEDGTLAGADLTMIDAVTYVHRTLGVPLDEALRMASVYPALALGVAAERGVLAQGRRADFVHLGDDLSVRRTVIGGAIAWIA